MKEAVGDARRAAALSMRGRVVWSYVVEAAQDETGAMRLSCVSLLRVSEEVGDRLQEAVTAAYDANEVTVGASIIHAIGEALVLGVADE